MLIDFAVATGAIVAIVGGFGLLAWLGSAWGYPAEPRVPTAKTRERRPGDAAR